MWPPGDAQSAADAPGHRIADNGLCGTSPVVQILAEATIVQPETSPAGKMVTARL